MALLHSTPRKITKESPEVNTRVHGCVSSRSVALGISQRRFWGATAIAVCLQQLRCRAAITTASICLFLSSPEWWLCRREVEVSATWLNMLTRGCRWPSRSSKMHGTWLLEGSPAPGTPKAGRFRCAVQAPRFPEGSCSRSAVGDAEPRATRTHPQTFHARTSAPCASLFLSGCKTAELFDCLVCHFQLTRISRLSSRP